MKVKKVQDSFTFLATSLKTNTEIWLYFKYKTIKILPLNYYFKKIKIHFEFFFKPNSINLAQKKRGAG
jgi:hypothetical protein